MLSHQAGFVMRLGELLFWRSPADKLRRRSLRRRCLALEALEDRCLLSVSPLPGASNFAATVPAQTPVNESTVGLYATTGSQFFLRNSNDSGFANTIVPYQPASNGLIAISGDWNGDGTATIGLYDPATSTFFLRNSNDPSHSGTDIQFQFGPTNSTLLPVAGDWNGSGVDQVGLYDQTTGTFHLREVSGTSVTDVAFVYGPANNHLLPIAGKWTPGATEATIGLYSPSDSLFFLRDSNTTGIADNTFLYGPANSGLSFRPITGDWTGVGEDTVGLYDSSSSTFFLRNSNDSGFADETFVYGPANFAGTPVVGTWNAPDLMALNPSSGSSAGGTPVTIAGTGFTGTTAVNFGSTPASFTVVSDNQINAISPAGTVGTVDVTVTGTGGVSATSTADQFTNSAPVAPTVAGVNPKSGFTAGGTAVTITGGGFIGATSVQFGTSPATSFTVVSDSQITATSPAGTGTVDVTVSNDTGTSATSTADQFTYTVPGAPTVSGISPNSGPTGGGTTVIITGSGFTDATSVRFGATSVPAFAVNSSTRITATSPAGTGIVDVTVTNAGGTSTPSAADQFTYSTGAPTVTGLSPNSGPTGGGTTVIITGTGFTDATSVRFGSTSAPAFAVNSSTRITATSPAGTAGTVDVTVANSGGTSTPTSADRFTYSTGTPTVTGISPTFGSGGGGTTVIITGTGFTDATSVRFGATSAPAFSVNSATRITADSPAGTGTVDVTVANSGGTSTPTAADRFTYTAG